MVAAGATHGAAAAAAFFVVGVAIGRWRVLVLPFVYWTVVAVGEGRRWWGPEPGEYLAFGAFVLAFYGCLAAGAGVLARAALERRR